MDVYKSSSLWHKFVSAVAIIIGFGFTISGLLPLVFFDFHILFLIFFLIGISLLYFYLFIYLSGAVLSESSIVLKAKLRTTQLRYSDVKKIVGHYTTNTLICEGWDKEKATIYYFIWIDKNPLHCFFFGPEIKGYKELSQRIAQNIDKSAHTPSRVPPVSG